MTEKERIGFALMFVWTLLVPAVSPDPKLIQPAPDPLALEVGCMADTPIILHNCLMVWPRTNKPVSSIECKLSGVGTLNCSKTAVLFTRVPAGIHRLVVTARTNLEEVSATYRLIVPADHTTCVTHLINRGVTVHNRTAVAEFSGFGPYKGFVCKLDSPTAFPCESPLVLHNLTVGEHWLRVIPDGCTEGERQTFFFNVPSPLNHS